jgi:excisionase family DNA binding protein
MLDHSVEGTDKILQALWVSQIAKCLDVCDKTARRIIEPGALMAHRSGPDWRVFESHFQAYLARQANRQAGRTVCSEVHCV